MCNRWNNGWNHCSHDEAVEVHINDPEFDFDFVERSHFQPKRRSCCRDRFANSGCCDNYGYCGGYDPFYDDCGGGRGCCR